MAIKIGKLNIGWGQKALTPYKGDLRPTPGNFRIMGLTVSWNSNEDVDNYASSAALYSIINRITRTAATAPFKVYRVKDKRKHAKYKAWTGTNATKESLRAAMSIKEQVYEEDNAHALNKLIEKCGSEFTAASIGWKLITGNRFLFVNKLTSGLDEGLPFSVRNLPSQYVTIIGDGSLEGVSGYKFTLGSVTDIPKESILHSKYFNPLFDSTGSHLRGLSPLNAAKKNITRIESSIDRSVSLVQNPGAGVMYDKNPIEKSIEEAQAIKLTINKNVLGQDNAGKVAFFNGDLGYLDLAMDAQQMEIIGLENQSLKQLCNIYGAPYIIFDGNNANYDNIQEAKKELITMAVVPELASLRNDWNDIATLYPGQDIYVDYDLSVYPEMQEDMGKTADIMAKAWWFTPNEKRLAMMQDEDTTTKEMNMYVIPSGLQLIEDLSNLEGEMNQVDEELEGDELKKELDKIYARRGTRQ